VGKKTIRPGGVLRGTIEVPGDKSISHRYAILAALAEGESEILNYSTAVDCRSTLECLKRLGAWVKTEKDRVRITGAGLDGLKASRRPLDAGNSGTTMRLLAGVLAGQAFESTLTGDDSLCRRPMGRVVEPLRQMGAQIQARDDNFAPLAIRAGNLRPVDYTMPVASAQVKSAILLAGLYADGSTSVREPVRTRDHLEIALREFGAETQRSDRAIAVRGRPRLEARSLAVPGDLSAAVFFLGAALVAADSSIVVHNVGLNPTRAGVLDFLIAMGAPIRLVSVQMRDGELVGDVSLRYAPLEGGVIAGEAVAQLIDELPMLAALGPYTEKGMEIRDAQELRVKESDRIAALAQGLRAMGAHVEEFPDGLRVAGRSAGPLRGGVSLDPQGDHRIAMALSVAALGAQKETAILDSGCVAISFPEFFPTLKRLMERGG
jgi:3-phosphoshikimate 1-carboxyvinyltransferase